MDLATCTDTEFDANYPIKMRKLSGTHWTPVEIARKAVSFFKDQGCNSVLDLGSGAGKFCLIAAAQEKIQITGIERRENLIQLSRKIAAMHQLQNLSFIQEDLNQFDFKPYDGFYFFNSFEENINSKDPLDSEQAQDLIQYQQYVDILHDKFEQLPAKTCIVTYCGESLEIPSCYQLVQKQNKGKLKFWKKI